MYFSVCIREKEILGSWLQSLESVYLPKLLLLIHLVYIKSFPKFAFVIFL